MNKHTNLRRAAAGGTSLALAALLLACGGGGQDDIAAAAGTDITRDEVNETEAAVDTDSTVSSAAEGTTDTQGSRLPVRTLERLDRGLVAVQKGSGWLLTWRLLGTEYGTDIAFDVYKGARKLNARPLSGSTNFEDTTAGSGTYTVRAIVGGRKVLARSKPALVLANGYTEIPLKPIEAGGYYVQHAWPGDLDGDGRYEFVVSRLPAGGSALPSYLEAYRLDGTFLWRVDLGVNSYTKDPGLGSNDAPPAAISGFGDTAGYRNDDDVTVYDLDGDGKAEVLVRTATGTTFADGAVIASTGATEQFISVIRGTTGVEVTRQPVPTDLLAYGPLSGNFGIGYFDGRKPSLVTKLVTRGPGKNGAGFQWLVAAWDFDGTQLTERWKWVADLDPAKRNGANRFHQIRVVDLDGDGKDEVADGNYVLDDDGTLKYVVDQAIHGDRFHIGDFDPARPGLEGFAIQQTEVGAWSNFPWYYYDAASGTRLITGEHPAYTPDKTSAADEKVWDVPRGTIADIDPRHPGYEFWGGLSSLDLPAAGVWNLKGERISHATPTVNFRIWWDGDVGSELLDGTVVDKWVPETETSDRLFEATGTVATTRTAQPFYGDVLGDWREEILLETADRTALRLYSTNIPTNVRLYTLAHNPEYRLNFTVRGYLQSNLVDYYLGHDMKAPPRPRIRTVQ